MIPNFIQFCQQMWKVYVVINLRTCVKKSFSLRMFVRIV